MSLIWPRMMDLLVKWPLILMTFCLSCVDLVLTLSWPWVGLVLTLSWPCIDLELTLCWPCTDLVLTCCVCFRVLGVSVPRYPGWPSGYRGHREVVRAVSSGRLHRLPGHHPYVRSVLRPPLFDNLNFGGRVQKNREKELFKTKLSFGLEVAVPWSESPKSET